MAKMAKKGFSHAAIEETKYLIKKPPAEVEKRRSRVLSFLGIKRCRLRYQDTRQCYVITNCPAACLAKLAPQKIHRHAGDAKERMHLPPPNAECGLQRRLQLHPARHPPQPVTLPELNRLKSSSCQLDLRIGIQLFSVWNFSKMIRIPSTIPIFFEIC
jgi:hypothetical protein